MYFFSMSYAIAQLCNPKTPDPDFVITSTKFPVLDVETLVAYYGIRYITGIERLVAMKNRVFQPRLSGIDGLTLFDCPQPYVDSDGITQKRILYNQTSGTIPKSSWPSWLTKLVDENDLGL